MRVKKNKQREVVIIEVTSWAFVLSFFYLMAKALS